MCFAADLIIYQQVSVLLERWTPGGGREVSPVRRQMELVAQTPTFILGDSKNTQMEKKIRFCTFLGTSGSFSTCVDMWLLHLELTGKFHFMKSDYCTAVCCTDLQQFR